MRRTRLAVGLAGKGQEGPFAVDTGVVSLVLWGDSIRTKRRVACGGRVACGPAEAGWVALACGRVRRWP